MPVQTSALSREKLIEIARTLPADLQVLSVLGEILQDVNTDLDDIANVIRRDVALGARVVRISNSPVFAGGGVSSVEEAVQRIGFAEVHRLVGMATTARLAERSLDYYGIEADALHDVMLFSALACEALARAVGEDPRPAYTAGLLRPLGIMVLDRAAKLRGTTDAGFTPGRDEHYAAWEGRIFGVTNCDIAALILEEWRFPRPLSNAVRDHYLRRPADLANPFAVRLNLACWIAREGGSYLAGEKEYWEPTREKVSAAGLCEERLQEAAKEAAITFAETRLAMV